MKILADRREDILKRKEAYESRLKAYNDKVEDRRLQLEQATRDVLSPVRDEIMSGLEKFSALQFDVRATRGWRLSRKGDSESGIEVRVQCNEHNKFSDSVALAWNYDVKIGDEGEVVAETGSWSGLQATTKEQLESLRQTVSALEYLNGLDWKRLLDKSLPRHSDYFKDLEPRPEKEEDFEAELRDAALADLIGTDKLVLVHPFESSGWRGNVYLKLLRETPSQYEVIVVPKHVVDQGRQKDFIGDHPFTQRVRKSNVYPFPQGDGVVTVEV